MHLGNNIVTGSFVLFVVCTNHWLRVASFIGVLEDRKDNYWFLTSLYVAQAIYQ